MVLRHVNLKVKRQSTKEKWSAFNLGRSLFMGEIKRHDHYIAGLLSGIVEKKKVIVEYGCGDGVWLEYLGTQFPDKTFIGVEWNDRLADYAEKTRLKNLQNVRVHREDATKVSVDCDFFFALGVVEHFDSATCVVKNWVQHLSPNGFTLMTVPNLLHWPRVANRHNIPLVKVRGKDEVTVKAYGFEQLWSHNTFLKKVMDAGLEILLYRIVEETSQRPQLVVAFKRGDKNQS